MRRNTGLVADDRLRRHAFVTQAKTLLASTGDDADWYLQGLADLAVPTFADWCVIEAIAADGTSAVRAESPPDEGRRSGARLRRCPRPGAPSSVARVAATGRAALFADLNRALSAPPHDLSDDLRAYVDLGVCSVLLVPIADADGHVHTVLCMLSLTPRRRFTEHDLRAMEKLACSATAVLERARHLSRGQEIVRASSELIADAASHELRTPLSALLLQLESLEAKLSQPVPIDRAATRRSVNRALEQAQRLRECVEALMDPRRSK